MSKRASTSNGFNPSTGNLGGRTVISQQMYNHYSSLLNTKSTVDTGAKVTTLNPMNKTGRVSRPIKIDQTTGETLELMKLAKANQPKSSVVLADGITTDQWKQIHDYKVIGQNSQKKKNYNIAIGHYFNLKSMYKKINQIKFKNAVQLGAYTVGKEGSKGQGQGDHGRAKSGMNEARVVQKGVAQSVTHQYKDPSDLI